MEDERKRIDGLPIHQNIELYQVCLTITGEVVIERGIALSTRFQLVIEINDEFRQRHEVGNQHTVCFNVLELLHHTALGNHQLHNCTNVARRCEDRDVHPGFFDLLNL